MEFVDTFISHIRLKKTLHWSLLYHNQNKG